MAKVTIAQLTERLDALEAQNETLSEQNGALVATIQNAEAQPAPQVAASPVAEGDDDAPSVATLKRAFYEQAEAIRKKRSMPAKLKAAKAIIRAMMSAGIHAKNESPDGLIRLGKWTRVALSQKSGLRRGALWNLEGEVAAQQQVR